MFQVLILVCAAGVSPADCQVETALDVVRGPTVTSEVLCGMHGQAYIAPTQMAPRNPGEFLKIKCTHAAPAQGAADRRTGIAGEGKSVAAADRARD